MKRLIGIALCGALFSTPAMAQEGGNGLFPLLLGNGGTVPGLVETLSTQNAQPLVNGLTGASHGLLQGNAGGTLNQTLTGLLVNQNPDEVAEGLQTTVTLLVEALSLGLTGNGDPAAAPDTLAELLAGLASAGGGGATLPGL